jgi:hypothetical protein
MDTSASTSLASAFGATNANGKDVAEALGGISNEGNVRHHIQRLGNRLRHIGLRQVVMGDDGNCQFRSFSYNIYGTQAYHKLVRARAVKHIKTHRNYFGVFFDGDAALDAYIESQSKTRTWGDELTLKAISEAYRLVVHVVTSTEKNWYLKYEPDTVAQHDCAKLKQAFVTYISPIHYNAISCALPVFPGDQVTVDDSLG